MSEKYFKSTINDPKSKEGGTERIYTAEHQRAVLESTTKKLHDIEKMHQEKADRVMGGFAEENYR